MASRGSRCARRLRRPGRSRPRTTIPCSRRVRRLVASSASRLCSRLAWNCRPSVKIATGGMFGSLLRSTKSGRHPCSTSCGSRVQTRLAPGKPICSRFPVGHGMSFTVAPRALTRSRNTLRKCCSRWDSVVSLPGGTVGRRPPVGLPGGGVDVRAARGQDRPQVPFGGLPGDQVHREHPPGERQQAAVARQARLVGARAVPHHLVGAVQQVPQPGRVGEFGEVPGAARHHVVDEQRLGGRSPTRLVAGIGDLGDGEVVRVTRRAARAGRAAAPRTGSGRRRRRRW